MSPRLCLPKDVALLFVERFGRIARQKAVRHPSANTIWVTFEILNCYWETKGDFGIVVSETKTLYITGAGVSAESGIPTFRGKDGHLFL